ncbi:MAG TPA: chorismate mutase [Gemmatimonadaceae bacterium]|nr:chorismate mutase [Gemmatimonadaceae bacterium]
MVTSRLEHPTSTQPRLKGVRGAITVEADTPAAIDDAVHELLDRLVEANGIDCQDLVSAIFSATPDVRRRNPATSARALGWTDVPLMCVAELETDGMLERCLRVLLHVNVVDGRRLTPVYLGNAACLRPDLLAAGPHALTAEAR